MKLVSIPVSKPEPLYQCGTWSTVYPPYNKNQEEKEQVKNERCKETSRGRWKLGVQYEPWET
jgi:hypothetical protein